MTPIYYATNHFVTDKRIRNAIKITQKLNTRGDITYCAPVVAVLFNGMDIWEMTAQEWHTWSLHLSSGQRHYKKLILLADPFGSHWIQDRLCRKAFNVAMRTKGSEIYEIEHGDDRCLLAELTGRQKTHYAGLIRRLAAESKPTDSVRLPDEPPLRRLQ